MYILSENLFTVNKKYQVFFVDVQKGIWVIPNDVNGDGSGGTIPFDYVREGYYGIQINQKDNTITWRICLVTEKVLRQKKLQNLNK